MPRRASRPAACLCWLERAASSREARARVRLGRIGQHARGKWLALSVLFLGSALVYGAVIGGQTARAYDALTGGIEHLAVAAGFGVKRITVTGQLHATDAAITAALGAGPDTMMLGFDTDAAKARLEAVPWIRHAQVMRLLPSTLQVVVEERTPYAVWQNHGQTYVVDAEGVVLAPALREAYAGLPLVVGEGAGKNAAQLFDQLTPFGDLTKDVIAAIRVGDRRWTLKLASGLEIMLPDDNIAEALTSLAKLDRGARRAQAGYRRRRSAPARSGHRALARDRSRQSARRGDRRPTYRRRAPRSRRPRARREKRGLRAGGWATPPP